VKKKATKHTQQILLSLLQENKKQQHKTLTLSNLGLVGDEPPLQQLSEYTWLETLSFTNLEGDLKETPNGLRVLPEGLPTSLRHLDCSGGYLQEFEIKDLSPIRHLKNLEKFYAEGNQLQDLSPLASLGQLEMLDLTDNKLEDISPLRHLGKLRELNLSVNQIQDCAPLSHLKALQFLNLNNNGIQELTGLETLHQLERLFIANNRIRSLAPLAGLAQLKELYASKNRISQVDALATLPQLTYVNLKYNFVAEVSALRDLPIFDTFEFDIHYNPITNLPWFKAYNRDVSQPMSQFVPEQPLPNFEKIYELFTSLQKENILLAQQLAQGQGWDKATISALADFFLKRAER